MKYLFSSFFILAINFCVNAQTIGEIQGSDSSSLFINTKVVTRGVVTFTSYGFDQYKGFYMQSAVSDGNPLTSDGIFVFSDKFVTDVVAGDEVEVSASVTEYFGLTELNKVTAITKLGNATPTPIRVSHKDYLSKMESLEGMWVEFTDTFTVCGNYNLGRYGQLEVSSIGRLYQPTHYLDPNDSDASGTNFTGNFNLSAIVAAASKNNQALLILDDGFNKSYPKTIPFFSSEMGTIRTGSKVPGLSGVIDFSFGFYKITPIVAPQFDYAPRPSIPVLDASQSSITSMNVLNYFTTLKERGANTATEFVRQKTKIINGMVALKTDVFALMEIENHPDNTALKDLVSGLNTALGSEQYQYIDNLQSANGADAIKVALVYNSSKVSPFGKSVSFSDVIFDRVPLAQVFLDNASGNKYLVVANHFKSKGCGIATGENLDQLDGQGCWNEKRRQQVIQLSKYTKEFAAQQGISDVLLVGDFNAYDQEDPLDVLRSEGYVSATEGQYSYVFSSLVGALDHAFVTPSLKSKITKAIKWNVNADEPILIDYNLENKIAGNDYYKPDFYRFSDHDPIVVQWRKGVITGNENVELNQSVNIEIIQSDSHLNMLVHGKADEVYTVIFYNILGQMSTEYTVVANQPMMLDSAMLVGCYQACVRKGNHIVARKKVVVLE